MVAKMTTYDAIGGLNRALRKLPPEAKAQLTQESKEIAGDVARQAQFAAVKMTRRIGGWKYLGPTIRAERSSKPGVKIGGNRRLKGRKGPNQTVGDLLWGLEFGGQARPTTRQFLPHLGTEGYVLWPTVREMGADIGTRYSGALMQALERTR